jgi:hypothetical protein
MDIPLWIAIPYQFDIWNSFYQFKDIIRLVHLSGRAEISFLQTGWATALITLRYFLEQSCVLAFRRERILTASHRQAQCPR